MPSSIDAIENVSEICKVCGAVLKLVDNPIVEKFHDNYLSFCSDECLAEYMTDPGKYSRLEEELE